MESAPGVAFHVQFAKTGDFEDDPCPGLQVFALNESCAVVDSSDYRCSSGAFLGGSVSWKLSSRDSYVAEINVAQVPDSCAMMLFVVRVSSSLFVRDLADSMSYSVSAAVDSAVQVSGMDLTFSGGDVDWFIVSAIVFEKSVSPRVLLKDISSFPQTRGNVINQIKESAHSVLREVPPPTISLSNWYTLWTDSKKEESADTTAILMSKNVPYMDDPIVEGDGTTSPRNLLTSELVDHHAPVVTFAPPSPTHKSPVAPGVPCQKCHVLSDRVLELERTLMYSDPDHRLSKENDILREQIKDLQIRLTVAETLVDKLKQVQHSSESFGYDISNSFNVNDAENQKQFDYSHLPVAEQVSCHLKVQEDLLVSVKEQVMKINNQLTLGRRLRGIKIPGEKGQIHQT